MMNSVHRQLPLVSTAVLTSSNFRSVNKCLMSLCCAFHRLPTDFQRLPKCRTHILFCFLRFPNSLLSATMVYDRSMIYDQFLFFLSRLYQISWSGEISVMIFIWSLISPMLRFPYYLTYCSSKSLSYWPWRPCPTFHVLFCFLYLSWLSSHAA